MTLDELITEFDRGLRSMAGIKSHVAAGARTEGNG